MSRQENAHRDIARERLAIESLDPAVAFEWTAGEGRSLKQYENDFGVSEEELLSADSIIDFGSGPTARPWISVVTRARELERTPPPILAVSAGYRDPDKRARVMRALKKEGIMEEIQISTELAHTINVPEGKATFVFAEHLFEHLFDEDVHLVVEKMMRATAPGGKAVIAKYPGPKTAEEVGLPRHTTMHQSVRDSIERNPGVTLRNNILRYAKTYASAHSDYRVFTEDVPSTDAIGKWYKHQRIVIERMKKPA